MIKYIIKSDGIKQVLDNTEDVLDILVKFKRKHPTLDYDMKLESPKEGDMTWTINLDINDGEPEEKIFTKRTKTH